MVQLAHDRRTALAMLVERLRWPVKMVRWRAAVGIRDLIENPETREAATDCLLSWMASRRLESEVLSSLSVLSATNAGSRPDFGRVAGSVSCPSLASDFLLLQIYGRTTDLWQGAHSGPMPDDFEVDPYFTENKSAQVPASLAMDLGYLEEHTRLPFIRQWGYEWSCLSRQLGARNTRYPNYFGDFGLQRQGIMGQFIQRQAEIYRSAYQRTLACAVGEWGVPFRAIASFATYGLPSLPDMFELAPQPRPDWIPAIDVAALGDPVDLVSLARSILDRQPAGADQVVSLRIPVDRSLGDFGELEISAFLVDDAFRLAGGQMLKTRSSFYGLDRFEFRGGRESEVPRSEDGELGTAISVCHDEQPCPQGYWHDDLYQVGARLPATYCFDRSTYRRVTPREVTANMGGETVGSTYFWLDAWTPMYAPNSSTRCGSVTLMKRRRLDAAGGRLGRKVGWFVRLSRMEKPTTYGDLEPTDRTAFLR